MLGILADESCPAACLLRHHGVTPDALRAKLSPGAGGNRSRRTPRCLSPPARSSALTGASVLARRSGTLDIAPMHVLLALVIPPDAADALGLRRDQVESLREEARAALDASDP